MTLSEARLVLEAARISDAAGDARRLLAFSDQSDQDAAEVIHRRAAGEPVSHILGYRDFWKHRFKVTPDVLDPRPDTETLVELALQRQFTRVLDLGTGSGCILISLLSERPHATGVGSDASHAAVLVAGENARSIGVSDRLILPVSDWYSDIGGRFDLIVSNPPYIAASEMESLQAEVHREPRMALTDDAEGLSHYRTIAAGAMDHLTDQGRILVEIGPTQARAVSALFAAAGLENITTRPDLDGRDRVVSALKTA